jgi:hypothetical protein
MSPSAEFDEASLADDEALITQVSSELENHGMYAGRDRMHCRCGEWHDDLHWSFEQHVTQAIFAALSEAIEETRVTPSDE